MVNSLTRNPAYQTDCQRQDGVFRDWHPEHEVLGPKQYQGTRISYHRQCGQRRVHP